MDQNINHIDKNSFKTPDMNSCDVQRVMKLQDFRFWFDAIMKDDALEMERLLSTADTHMVQLLVNGHFEFQQMDSETHPLTKQIAKCFHVSYPIQMVAVYGKQNAFQILMKCGGNILIQDDFKNNILHLMCYVINGNPEREEKARMFYKWLVNTIAPEHLRKLLSEKNSNNLNAETTAVALGTMGLCLDMFKTRGMCIFLGHDECTDLGI